MICVTRVEKQARTIPLLSQDDDPYVRKTAAVCVTKLFDINAELVEDRGFLDMLRVSSTLNSNELPACGKGSMTLML